MFFFNQFHHFFFSISSIDFFFTDQSSYFWSDKIDKINKITLKQFLYKLILNPG